MVFEPKTVKPENVGSLILEGPPSSLEGFMLTDARGPLQYDTEVLLMEPLPENPESSETLFTFLPSGCIFRLQLMPASMISLHYVSSSFGSTHCNDMVRDLRA